MAFSVSGLSAVGANEGLQQVLERRLKEAQRADAERQRAIDNQMAREDFALRQQTAKDLQNERVETRQRAERAENVGVAGRTMANLLPGTEVSEETAKNIELDPANAGLVAQRKIIDAKPRATPSVLPGTVTPEPAGDVGGPTLLTGMKPQLRTIDARPVGPTPTAMGGDVTATQAPGGQSYGPKVYGGTPGQIETQRKKVDLQRIGKALTTPGITEEQKLSLLGEAISGEVAGDIPDRAWEPSEREKQETADKKLAEMRKYEEGIWQDHFRQQQGAIDARATRDKPPTGLQMKMMDFHNRVVESNSTLDLLEDKLTPLDIATINGAPAFLPETMSNWLKSATLSEAGQRYALALSTFSDPRLREASGAVINTGEYQADRGMFARQLNDTPALKAQRVRIRKLVEEGLAFKAGTAYDAFHGYKFEPTIRPGDQGKGKGKDGKGGGVGRVKVSVDKDGNLVETPVK